MSSEFAARAEFPEANFPKNLPQFWGFHPKPNFPKKYATIFELFTPSPIFPKICHNFGTVTPSPILPKICHIFWIFPESFVLRFRYFEFTACVYRSFELTIRFKACISDFGGCDTTLLGAASTKTSVMPTEWV